MVSGRSLQLTPNFKYIVGYHLTGDDVMTLCSSNGAHAFFNKFGIWYTNWILYWRY